MNIVRLATCMDDVLKVAYRFGWRTRALTKLAQNGNAIVIGNGPSLEKTLEMHPDGFLGYDAFCVNSFPKTDAFLQIRPRFCVFADPCYWESSAADRLKEDRDNVFRAIDERATWGMYVLFPAAAKKYHKLSSLKFSNPQVTLLYFNSTTITNALPLRIRSYLYRNFLAVAGMQTVTCGALSLAISMGYKKINLVGVDASFLEDVIIDDGRNMLVTKDCHYYDDGHEVPVPIFADVNETRPMLVHEYLECIAKMFKGFYECNLFAGDVGAMITNSSVHSWIDSFARDVLDND